MIRPWDFVLWAFIREDFFCAGFYPRYDFIPWDFVGGDYILWDSVSDSQTPQNH